MSLSTLEAQQKTTVTANSIDISDNLDLRAVASLFGESHDLEDFERKLNDPEIKISNLDLNQDNQVDYLRVVEILENNQHLIVIQAVLGQDLFQDIATLEVEKEARTQRVQVQVVGNEYFYGTNYVYEPVFITRPVIFNYFWRPHYVAYYSPWYWGYYPTYYYGWNPYPIYTYRNHIGLYINVNNYCHYRPNYRSHYYYSNHYRNTRFNAYERQYPNRSFSNRNQGFANRNELSSGRNTTGRNTTADRSQLNNRTENNVRNQTANRSQVSNRIESNSRSNMQNNRVETNNTQRLETNTRNNVVGNGRITENRNTNLVVVSNRNSRSQTVSPQSTNSTRVQNTPATRSVRENRSQPSISQNRVQARPQAAPARPQLTRSTATPPRNSSTRGSATPSGRSSSSLGGRG